MKSILVILIAFVLLLDSMCDCDRRDGSGGGGGNGNKRRRKKQQSHQQSHRSLSLPPQPLPQPSPLDSSSAEFLHTSDDFQSRFANHNNADAQSSGESQLEDNPDDLMAAPFVDLHSHASAGGGGNTFAVDQQLSHLGHVSSSSSSSSQHQCQEITVDTCRGIGYNVTSMPNLVGHELQSEAELQLQTFAPLISYGCSSQLRFFLCSVYFPMCTEKVPVTIGPCRPLCESVRDNCAPVLQNLGFQWPDALNCSKFNPVNQMDQMCMDGPPPEPPQSASGGSIGSVGQDLSVPFIPVVPLQPQPPRHYNPISIPHKPHQPNYNPLDERPRGSGQGGYSHPTNTHHQQQFDPYNQRPVPQAFDPYNQYPAVVAPPNVPLFPPQLPQPQPPPNSQFNPDLGSDFAQPQPPAQTQNPPKSTSSIRKCHHYRQTEQYVFLELPTYRQQCVPRCAANILFSADNKSFADTWSLLWAVPALLSCLFTVVVFIIAGGSNSKSQNSRRRITGTAAPTTNNNNYRYPERAIVYIAGCYSMVASAHLYRAIVGRAQMSCHLDPLTGASLLVAESASNLHCQLSFVMLYYFGMASAAWWLILAGTWSVSTAFRWSAAELGQHRTLYHSVAWILPMFQTLTAMLTRTVDADELTGTCFVGHQDRAALLNFVLLPSLFYLGTGFCFFAGALLFRRLFVVHSGGEFCVDCQAPEVELLQPLKTGADYFHHQHPQCSDAQGSQNSLHSHPQQQLPQQQHPYHGSVQSKTTAISTQLPQQQQQQYLQTGIYPPLHPYQPQPLPHTNNAFCSTVSSSTSSSSSSYASNRSAGPKTTTQFPALPGMHHASTVITGTTGLTGEQYRTTSTQRSSHGTQSSRMRTTSGGTNSSAGGNTTTATTTTGRRRIHRRRYAGSAVDDKQQQLQLQQQPQTSGVNDAYQHYQNQPDSQALFRSAMFALFYALPALVVFACNLYEYYYRDSWLLRSVATRPATEAPLVTTASSLTAGGQFTEGVTITADQLMHYSLPEVTSTASRPLSELFNTRLFMSLVIGVNTGIWVLIGQHRYTSATWRCLFWRCLVKKTALQMTQQQQQQQQQSQQSLQSTQQNMSQFTQVASTAGAHAHHHFQPTTTTTLQQQQQQQQHSHRPQLPPRPAAQHHQQLLPLLMSSAPAQPPPPPHYTLQQFTNNAFFDQHTHNTGFLVDANESAGNTATTTTSTVSAAKNPPVMVDPFMMLGPWGDEPLRPQQQQQQQQQPNGSETAV